MSALAREDALALIDRLARAAAWAATHSSKTASKEFDRACAQMFLQLTNHKITEDELRSLA